MYNFVSTVQKPTAVFHSVTGCFTAPDERNLIISKGTKLEIFTLTPEGLSPVLDVNIYGRISSMKLISLGSDKQERLFILTEKYKFCILGYNSATKELVTCGTGDAEGIIGRPAEAGQIGIVDPDSRLIGMHLYEGLFKAVPLDRGQVKDSFSTRLEQLQVIDMVFLYQCPVPTLALLYKDTRDARHLTTYTVDIAAKELVEGVSQDSVEENSSMLVALENGALLVVGEMAITYLNLRNNTQSHTTTIEHTHIVAYEKIDRDRFLFSDDCGNLYLLHITFDQSKQAVLNMKWERLGETSIASSISYLDSGVVYVGSSSGDSQLIRLNSNIDPNTNSYISILDQFTNLGPITDFCIVDNEKQGQGQIVTCSGTFQDGSLRIIRNGIGISEQASIELPGIRGLWSLSNNTSAGVNGLHRHLIVSFINSTKVLTFSGEEIEETEIAGFDCNSPTLYCGNTSQANQYIQISTSGIYLVDSTSLMLLDQYRPEKGSINLASCNGSQILISQGNNLTYIEIENSSLVVKKETQLQYEISCLDISLLDGFNKSPVCAVGLWTDISIRILQLPNLNEVCKETLGGEILPRSILFITFEGTNYLLCSLGDGHLFNFTFDIVNNTLNERKKLSLGTTPIILNSFKLKNTTNVFASSDRPTVIYSNNKKLLYSAINMKVVSHVCSFNSEAFRDSIAIATESSLVIGTIDEIQKLHIRTVPLGEMARRITYIEENHCYAVITIQRNEINDSKDGVPLTNYVKLLNEQTFETSSKYALKNFEFGWSIVSCKFKGDDTLYIVVGTAFHNDVESQQTKGRILVFRIEENRLILVDEQILQASVYCLLPFNGRLLAGVNKRVQAFNWTGGDTNNFKLVKAESYSGHTLSHSMVSRGHFILVADLMKSMTLLIEEENGAIKELARNPQPIWLSRIEMIDDETFIGGDNSYNLVVVQKNAEASNEIDNELLDGVGHYHLGETINKFCHGSLVTSPDIDAPKLPTILFGTVSGSIGIIASITKEDYEFFSRLQKGLNRVVHGVGGLSHDLWRSFNTEHMTVASKNFIDGDLIETFLDLRQGEMLEAIKDMDTSIEDTYHRIESLMHHIR